MRGRDGAGRKSRLSHWHFLESAVMETVVCSLTAEQRVSTESGLSALWSPLGSREPDGHVGDLSTWLMWREDAGEVSMCGLSCASFLSV